MPSTTSNAATTVPQLCAQLHPETGRTRALAARVATNGVAKKRVAPKKVARFSLDKFLSVRTPDVSGIYEVEYHSQIHVDLDGAMHIFFVPPATSGYDEPDIRLPLTARSLPPRDVPDDYVVADDTFHPPSTYSFHTTPDPNSVVVITVDPSWDTSIPHAVLHIHPPTTTTH